MVYIYINMVYNIVTNMVNNIVTNRVYNLVNNIIYLPRCVELLTHLPSFNTIQQCFHVAYCLINTTFLSTALQLLLFVTCASPWMVRDLVGYWLNGDIITVQYSTTRPHLLDIYWRPPTGPKLKPVVVYLVGGAWMCATKRYGLVVGKYLQTKDVLLVVPDIGNFPFATIPSMVDSTQECIAWVVANIAQYGGDPASITIVGHSSGGFVGHRAIQSLPHPLQGSVVSFVSIGTPFCMAALKASFTQWGIEVLYCYMFGVINASDGSITSPLNGNVQYFIIHSQHDKLITYRHIEYITITALPTTHCSVLTYPTKHSQLMVEDLLFNRFYFLDTICTIAHKADVALPTDRVGLPSIATLHDMHERLIDDMHERLIDDMHVDPITVDPITVKPITLGGLGGVGWWYHVLVFINPI